MASSTSSHVRDANTRETAACAAASDGYGRPAAIAAANRRDAQHDSITAAGRYLAANGFEVDPARAIYRYNHADEYVAAVTDYAAILDDPATFAGFYNWDVYYVTTQGDVVLPIGYSADQPIPVSEYLATHPQ